MPRPCRCAGVSVWKTHATVEAVVGDGGAGLGVELEAGQGGVVADRHDGHVGGDAGKLNRAMPPP
jgi:hypothetical protein